MDGVELPGKNTGKWGAKFKYVVRMKDTKLQEISDLKIKG